MISRVGQGFGGAGTGTDHQRQVQAVLCFKASRFYGAAVEAQQGIGGSAAHQVSRGVGTAVGRIADLQVIRVAWEIEVPDMHAKAVSGDRVAGDIHQAGILIAAAESIVQAHIGRLAAQNGTQAAGDLQGAVDDGGGKIYNAADGGVGCEVAADGYVTGEGSCGGDYPLLGAHRPFHVQFFGRGVGPDTHIVARALLQQQGGSALSAHLVPE